MADKVTSMRLNEDDLEQFKEFAKENGLNQQQAFNSLLNMVKLENAKEKLGDRAKSIETFKDTINRAIGMYVNSLEENSVAEERIREELSKELNTKDNTISNLQEQLQKVKSEKSSIEERVYHLNTYKDLAENEVKKLENAILEKTNNLDIANRNNNNLQEQLAEYKKYKDDYKALHDQLDKLKETNTNLINENNKLNDKLNNNKDMLEFYKNQIETQQKELASLNVSLTNKDTSYKTDIKTLEDKHKEEILDVKDLYKNTLESKTNEYQDHLAKLNIEFKDKLDLELQKKQLEIDKLNNELTLTKTHKTKA